MVIPTWPEHWAVHIDLMTCRGGVEKSMILNIIEVYNPSIIKLL